MVDVVDLHYERLVVAHIQRSSERPIFVKLSGSQEVFVSDRCIVVDALRHVTQGLLLACNLI